MMLFRIAVQDIMSTYRVRETVQQTLMQVVKMCSHHIVTSGNRKFLEAMVRNTHKKAYASGLNINHNKTRRRQVRENVVCRNWLILRNEEFQISRDNSE